MEKSKTTYFHHVFTEHDFLEKLGIPTKQGRLTIVAYESIKGLINVGISHTEGAVDESNYLITQLLPKENHGLQIDSLDIHSNITDI